MAQHCNLSEDQIQDLFKATYGSIITSIKNGKKYDPKQFIKDLYNSIYESSDKDQAKALDYVQHIPKMINVAQANDDSVSDHLIESGVSMDQLIKLRKDFDTSLDNVIDYLDLNTNKELETATEIVESSPAASPVTNTQGYTEVEDYDKQIKEANYRKTYVVANDGTVTFIAKPTTGLALINQEAQNYGGVKAEQNIVDSDVKKRAYFSLVRNINNLVNGVNADDLKLGDVTGIFLRAMPANKIALEDLYTEQQEYFNTSDKNGTSEEKLKKRETGNEILMVYTDKKGNILYFDENGIPTTKENGGTIAYATTRKVNVDAKGNKFIRSVQSITDLSSKPGAASVEDIINSRNSEIETLEAMREYAVKNPNEVLLFSVAPGKNGYIREDFSKRNSISSIQLESGFNPFYSSIDDGPYQKGGVYFTVPDYDLPVLIQRPKFSEIPNFVEDLAKIVFDSNLPAQNKIDILKQFTYSEDTAVFEKEGNVVVKQGTDVLNSSVAEDRQTFINNLNGQVVNINKYLLGKDFQMPVDGNVQTKKYNNFLSENFYTNLQKNDDGKLIKLNAYNVLQPTMDATEKMFKVEEQPKTEKESALEQETPTDQSDDDFDKAIEGFDFGLKKLSILSSAATQQQIAEAKTWYEKSPLSKVMPFKEMFNVVNSDARAMFTKSGIMLFSGSNYTDLYHEGWHVFSQMFLTKADKKKLYGELRKLSGTFTTLEGKSKSFKDATDFQLEEFVAEDFRKYVISGGKKIIDGRTARNGIFKRIYNFLKALFTGQSIKNYLLNEEATGTLKELYDKLYVGELNEYKPTLRNVQFTQLNKGAQELTAAEGENKGLNYQDSMVLNETIDYLMASILQEKKLGVGALFVNPKLMGPLYVEIKKRLSKLVQTKENIAKEYVNHSGGAYGADTFWDLIGREFGVVEHKHYREVDNARVSKQLRQSKVEATAITKDQLEAARDEVERLLGVRHPDTKEGNLQVRNYYQVANSDGVYAIAELQGDARWNLGSVFGGTNTAVQLGIKMNKPVYVWDVASEKWHKYNPTTKEFELTKTPTLTKNFAGVGTRDIEDYQTFNTKTQKWENRKEYLGKAKEEAAKQAIKDVYENTFGKAEEASKITDSGNKILEFALNNWGDFNKVVEGEQQTGVIAFHKQRSNFLSFDEKYAELSPAEQDDVDGEVNLDTEENPMAQSDAENREMFGEKAFERKGTEHSVRSLASNEVVYLIKSLPKVDKQGRIEYNALGTPKLADFNRSWGIVINTVVGSVNKSEMYNRLVKGAEVYPELKILADRLQRPSSKVDPKTDNPYIQMWGAFFRDFSMYKIPIKELQIIKTSNSTKDGFNFEVRYVESEPVFKQVEKNFVTLFQTAVGGRYINKVDGVNYLNLNKVFEDFPTTASLSEGNNAMQFLKAVGFNLTDNTDVRKNLVKQEVKTHINYIYLRFKDSINFKNIDNPINFLNSNRTDGKFKGRNNSTDVQRILEVEGKYSTNYTNNSITNVDGNLEHDISLNNSITQLFKELNDPNKKTYQEIVSQPHMAHLNIEKNPSAKYSMLFNSMFELPITYKEVTTSNLGQRRTISIAGGVQPVTMNLDNINGIKSILDIVADAAINEGGIKTANLDPNSKFLQDMHTMLESGVMEFTRRGSKSSAFGASVTEINSPYNEHDGGKVTAKHLYISPGHFFNKVTPSDPKGSIVGYNYAVDIIKEKIAAEMERIAILKADIESGGELSKIPGFNKRGLTFTMFDDILSKGLKKDLIEKADAKNSYQVVNSAEFKQRISDDVIKYLSKLTKENMDFFNEMPYLSDQLKNTLDKLGRAAGTIGANATVGQGQDAAIRAFTVNALIHNMEMIALVDGDLAMYNHDKEEYNKRNASVTSTGRIFSADKSDFAFINNLRAGRTYANKIGAPKREFNGVLNTAIFKDNEIGSVYYKEYFDALMATKKYTEAQVKKILKNYSPGKMNEGDAQGWITFDAYRELALLEGNAWSPKQDELYAKIIAGEEVDPTEIAEFFPPRKYQYAGPLQTNQLHIQAFHKYSLVPLVPSVIKSTNMRILHDNLVKQGFDYALFESGSKMATMTKDGSPTPLYKDGDNRVIEEWNGTEETKYANNPIFLQYLKNQVDIAPKWKNKTIFSTQLRKLIINDIFKKGIPKNDQLESLVNEFEGLLTTLQSYKRQELLEEIGWTKNEKGEPVGDKKKLIEFVRKEIARQDFADHDIEFIDLDANGNLKNDLSLSLNAEKIEKLLNSVVIKRLIRQKMNGEQLVQVSGAGFETSNRTAFSKASEEDILKYRGTNDLPAYRPGKGKNGNTTAMKVKIAMKGDYYKLLELKDNDGRKIGTIDRLNAMLKSDKWLDKDDNRKLVTMVGVRIPVQGLNSMEFMEIYEFLPEEAGNIIIPASEIVAKSGSDFDIDKLTIFQPNYSSSKKYASYSKGDNAKGTENKVIEVIRKILEHPENFDALIRPNDTDLVKGTADQLADFNIQGYDPMANKSQDKRTVEKNGKTVTVISPTRSLEQRYNLYKHESNNVGKKTLGIGAVDNSYSSIFKRIGAYLQDSYTYRTVKKKGNHKRDVHIAMEHNTQIKNGKKYISLSDVNTTTMDKVSDLISQLMNGWVDVEKDAWIFNINGNDVAGPVMLFLLEAGVDFKTAAYFISQPLVIDYIKERSRAQSPFYQASDSGVLNTRTTNSLPKGQKGLDKYNIRKEFIRKYVDEIPINPKNGNEMFSSKIMYEDFIKPQTSGITFTPEELLSNIKAQDKDSETSMRTLMHFFELEDMMRDLTNVKLTMNVDTKPSKTFFDAQSKMLAIEGLKETDIVSQEMLSDIKYKSPIASFFTQAFQLNLFKPMMKIRADKMVNDFLIETVKSDPFDIMSTTFKDDPEKFVAAFKNDIPLFLLQNYIKGIDLTTMKEYKSLSLDKTTPIVDAGQLKYGAFVKDGVMYVDADQINKDFDTKSFAGEGYAQRGLHQVNPGTFAMSGNRQVDLQEYTHFVLEREALRSVTPIQEGQSRAGYEKQIADKALINTYNFYTLLKSPSSNANLFLHAASKYAKELPGEYTIFEQVVPDKGFKDKGIKTLKFKAGKVEKDMVNILHENLVRLADPDTIKIKDPKANAELSRFFGRLIISEYLRSGITKTNDSLAPILPTDVLMQLLREPMQKGITEQMIKEYSHLFKGNWGVNRKKTRNKFRNYIKPKEVIQPTEEEIDDFSLVRQNNKGLNVFTSPTSIESTKELIAKNPQYTLLYGGNAENLNEPKSDEFQKGNSLSIPVKPGRGITNLWTDETYNDNIAAITKALDAIDNAKTSGQDVAFPEEGFTTVIEKKDLLDENGNLVKENGKTVRINVPKDILRENAPNTFDYLATELYSRYGYVHPGAENALGFRKLYQKGQSITDEMVDDFMKKCFGE